MFSFSRTGTVVHATAATVFVIWSYALKQQQPPPLGLLLLCMLVGLLPDMDTTASTVGRLLPEISSRIESRFGHRTITHSLCAVGLVAAISYTVARPDWDSLTAAYASHILVDMVIGGNVGVAILWPLRWRFKLADILPTSRAEMTVGIALAVFAMLPLLVPRLAQDVNAAIPYPPTATPTRTPLPPVPTLVTIHIPHVYDQASEILVDAGDAVRPGKLLADLQIWRATLEAPSLWQLLPTPTPPPTATPVPYVAPLSPEDQAAAAADLTLAQARSTAAFAPPSATQVASVCDQVAALQNELEAMRNRLWADQLARDALKIRAAQPGSNIPWEQIGASEAALAEQERTIAYQVQRIADQDAACATIRSQPYAADANDQQVAAAELRRAEVRYRQAIATPLPPSPTVTRTPTPLPSPTPTPDTSGTWVRSPISGTVYAVSISQVDGDQVTVQVDVAVGYGFVQPAVYGGAGLAATITRVVDGDTIVVRFADGQEETIRLLDVDTPETVKPNAPVECFGPEASAYMQQRLCGAAEGGRCSGIKVQVEPAERDRFGRLLAYVWVDGVLLNEELVAQGYGVFNDYGFQSSPDPKTGCPRGG